MGGDTVILAQSLTNAIRPTHTIPQNPFEILAQNPLSCYNVHITLTQGKRMRATLSMLRWSERYGTWSEAELVRYGDRYYLSIDYDKEISREEALKLADELKPEDQALLFV